MGWTGAFIADWALKLTGLTSLLLVVLPGAWGLRLIRHRPIPRLWLRLIAVPAALSSLAIAFALLPGEIGFGGIIGHVLLDRMAGEAGLDRPLFAFAGLGAGLALAYFTLAYTAEEWRAGAERLFRMTGFLGRWTVRLALLLARSKLFARRPADRRAAIAAERRRTRIEPHLTEGAGEEDAYEDPLEFEDEAEEEVEAPPSPRAAALRPRSRSRLRPGAGGAPGSRRWICSATSISFRPWTCLRQRRPSAARSPRRNRWRRTRACSNPCSRISACAARS
jgi:S-DNA-T family DNA segregation ATPase FtsK/SpoIIIE